jgi:metal-responsive CopG/Arc/MetJ family transcriptional regulator
MARTTINLEPHVLAGVRRLAPQRGLSRFVNEALREKIDALERQRFHEEMKAGYIATRDDRNTLNVEWGAVDGEGWPA